MVKFIYFAYKIWFKRFFIETILRNIFKIIVAKTNCFGVYATVHRAEDPEDYIKASNPRRFMHSMRRHKNKKAPSARISAEKVTSEGLKKNTTIKNNDESANNTGNNSLLQNIQKMKIF